MKNIKENIELINCEIPTGVPIIFTKRKNYVGYKVVEPITDTSEIKKKFMEKFVEQNEENDFFESWATKYTDLVWNFFEPYLKGYYER